MATFSHSWIWGAAGAQTQSSGPHLFSYNQRLCLFPRKVILTSKRSLGENYSRLILVHMPISGPIIVPREINGQAWSPVSEHWASHLIHMQWLLHRKEVASYQSKRKGMWITPRILNVQQMSTYFAWQYEYRGNKTWTSLSRDSFPPAFFIFLTF